MQIAAQEEKADRENMLDAELKFTISDLDSTTGRLKKAKQDLVAAKHEVAIEAKAADVRRLEDEKDRLNQVLRALTTQSNARATLALKRNETKKRQAEIDLTLVLWCPQLGSSNEHPVKQTCELWSKAPRPCWDGSAGAHYGGGC